jgi:spermidine synthase
VGAFLTDFALVPAVGLFATQVVAIALNALAGVGALALAARVNAQLPTPDFQGPKPTVQVARSTPKTGDRRLETSRRSLVFVCAAIALSGFAALGMEILWLRHFTLQLGGFRAVFSLLMTVVLAGIGIGALVGGALDRRLHRPVGLLMVVQALFVVSALGGLASADVRELSARGRELQGLLPSMSDGQRLWAEVWFNLRPLLAELALPALLMGCSFPLANAVVQDTARVVGRRAGLLYLSNTAGAVAGSLVAGYVLLPMVGLQGAAFTLALAGTGAIVALAAASGFSRKEFLASAALAATALIVWATLPPDFLLQRALTPQGPGGRIVALSEGATELIAVAEIPGRGRGLLTNGHAMASTARLDQRYMRALAHVPLLAMDQPERVLVIGFGVGNTTHAASLHPSVRRIDVADLSRHILEHAPYFRDANHDVLSDPRVQVFLNDGRQHLQMQPPSTYDLITLEPPPISHAGVGALYSREFYELARTRLRDNGYVTQWLPAYQVPAESSLAMVRAFVEVFPQAVLLSGSQAELLLVGRKAPSIEIDPDRLARALERMPQVAADLRRLDLGSAREIIGSFVGSAATLQRATRNSAPVTDDRPLQEYGVRSALATAVLGVPADLFDLGDLSAWCPRCFQGERLVPSLEGLDTYLTLLGQAYSSRPDGPNQPDRVVLGSAYLGAVVPDDGETQRILALDRYERGERLLEQQRFEEAVAEFRAALAIAPSAEVHNNLGVALASLGRVGEATEHFKQAVALNPAFEEARNNLLMAQRGL